MHTQFTAVGGRMHVGWANRRLNKKYKQLGHITTDIETLDSTRQQALEKTEPEFTAQVGRIIDLKKQIAELKKMQIEKEVGQLSEVLAQVEQSLKVPLAGTLYCPRGTPSWKKDERPPEHCTITLEQIQPLFHLPRNKAAASLGIKNVSSFMKVCQALGVQHWQSDRAPRSSWTKEEDKKVEEGVARLGVKNKGFSRIAQELPGRTAGSVRTCWFTRLDPAIKRGVWTAEEDKLLNDLYATHGRSWEKNRSASGRALSCQSPWALGVLAVGKGCL